MTNFKVGDKVQVTSKSTMLAGATGKIVRVWHNWPEVSPSKVKVQFDKPIVDEGTTYRTCQFRPEVLENI